MAKFPLVICIPSEGRPVQLEWALSLLALNRPMNMNNVVLPIKGEERGPARDKLAKRARREMGADYIAFMDDDTAWPSDGLLKLMYELQNAPKDVKVIAGIYTAKDTLRTPLVFQKPGEGSYWDWTVGEVFECTDFIATGAMLIKGEVFDEDGLPEPWFRDISNVEEAASLDALNDVGVPESMIWDFRMTDDAFFCRKLRKHGGKILAHGGVLPIHWGQDGTPYAMTDASPPVARFYLKEAKARGLEIEKALAIDGWMSYPELAWLASQAKDHKKIVELGSYKGRSTRALVDNTQGTVWALDDWLGPRNTSYLGRVPDMANLFEEFKKNLDGVNGKLRIVDEDHSTATVDFKPDMVFIDGSHEYEDVKRDIHKWRTKVHRGGMLCGHDIDWPGVEKAVKELVPGYQTVPNTTIWWKEVK